MTKVHVPLDWERIDWRPHETWKKDILPRLDDHGMRLAGLKRSVYVIRLNGEICIQYPMGQSPVLYIGEGGLGARISQHRKWAHKLQSLVGDHSFQICVTIPRIKGNSDAYRDVEAALLEYFGHRYGTTPLWNKQYETRKNDHYVYSERSIKEALGKRSGAKYHWAIRPMQSSQFNRFYEQAPKHPQQVCTLPFLNKG